jgi:adenylate kinase family enzyme
MKIAIIGSPGSGKSTLARKLHEKLQIPLYHIDHYFWKPGWQRPDREEFAKIHHELCDRNEWILDGMALRHFAYRIEKADVVIFLDVPFLTSLYRIYKRAISDYWHQRNDNPEGCPHKWPDWEFLAYIYKFHTKQKSEVKRLLEEHKQYKKIFVIKNNDTLNEVINNITLIKG